MRIPNSITVLRRNNDGLVNAVQKLEQQADYVHAAFESSGEGILTTDKSGRINHANPAALQILGYKKKEVIGQWFQNILIAVSEYGQEIDLRNRPHTMAILTKKPVSAKLYYRTKNGTPVPVNVTISPIIARGRVCGVIEIIRDISNEQEFDQLKSEFISLASHQLRTPLTAISTYTHMLIGGFMGEVKKDQLGFLNTILASADRMNNLIDTLLSVSRLESGSIDISIGNVDVCHAVSKAKQELWPLAVAKHQTITTKTPETQLVIHTDELILAEICANLISNAIKYTPDGGKITIEVAPKNKGVIIQVRDNGYGIPPHLQRRVFSKFFRAPNILREESVGTGLGLYLAKEMVTRIGGNIRFKSRENKGSTFIVEIPDRHTKGASA